MKKYTEEQKGGRKGEQLRLLFIVVLAMVLSLSGNWLYAGGDLQLAGRWNREATMIPVEMKESNTKLVNAAAVGTTINLRGEDPIVDFSGINKQVKTLELAIHSEAKSACTLRIGTYCDGTDYEDPTGLIKGAREIVPGENVVYIPVDWHVDTIRFLFQGEAGDTFNIRAIRNVSDFASEGFWSIFLYRVLLWFAGILFILLHTVVPVGPMYERLFRHRYLAGAAIIFIGVALNFNGSSISLWDRIVTGNETGVIFGYGQSIRSDEWKTFFPMISSQAYTTPPYQWYNSLLRGTSTNIFLVYALPVRTVWMIFRPFLTGFLVLGTTRGLSFFWCSRMVCLFLASFEFFRIITGDRRRLSAGAAMMLLFSPLVEWWFAINGLVEMLIFGSAFIVALYTFLKLTECHRDTGIMCKKVLLVLLMVICGGGYIMTLYPAWMVPLAYVYLAMLIWIVIHFRNRVQLKWTDVILLCAGVLLLAGSVGYLFFKCRDVIEMVSNTVYPGKRLNLGGEAPARIFYYPASIHFPRFQNNIAGNVCEAAGIYTLFPLGILLSLIGMIRQRRADAMIVLSFLFGGFVYLFSAVGFPEWLAVASLLSNSFSERAYLAVDFFNLILLFRGIALLTETEARRIADRTVSTEVIGRLLLVLGCIALVTAMNVLFLPKYYRNGMLLASAAVLGCAIAVTVFFIRKHTALCVMFTILALLNGLMVNPLQIGTGDLYQSDLSWAIQSIRMTDPDALWGCANNKGYNMENYPVMNGVRELTSVNIYPNLTTWNALDTGVQEDQDYNRYAHYIIELDGASVDSSDQFELLSNDWIRLHLSNQDVVDLGIKYLLTVENIATKSDQSVTYRERGHYGEFYLFQVISGEEMRSEES